MLISVEHITQDKSKIKYLYLFFKIRNYAKSRGGYFHGFSFSRHERERLLPWLRQNGYITGWKINSYRKICLAQEFDPWKMVELREEQLENKNSFKRWILTITEAMLMDWRYKLQNGKLKETDHRSKSKIRKQLNGKAMNLKRFRIEKFSEGYSGRISNLILSESIGICKQTISNWRKKSKKGANTYFKKIFVADDPACFPESINGFHYSKKKRSYIHVDLKIYSYFNNVSIFINKHVLKYANLKSCLAVQGLTHTHPSDIATM